MSTKWEIVFQTCIASIPVAVTRVKDEKESFMIFISIPAGHRFAGKDVYGCAPRDEVFEDVLAKFPDAACCYTYSCDVGPLDIPGTWWYGYAYDYDDEVLTTFARAMQDALKVGWAWAKIINRSKLFGPLRLVGYKLKRSCRLLKGAKPRPAAA